MLGVYASLVERKSVNQIQVRSELNSVQLAPANEPCSDYSGQTFGDHQVSDDVHRVENFLFSETFCVGHFSV